MCGIAGIVNRMDCCLDMIFRMSEVQTHRGPDGQGHLFISGRNSTFCRDKTVKHPSEARVALGHRRLAILDCSEAGLQPMSADNGAFWICYNGEVYNYLELRQELQQMDFAFATGTDTEVVLAAYRAWGTNCFRRFNGMWSLAIWDARLNRLILSRDRFGVKPLHYVFHGQSLVFASEIKALHACGFTRSVLNRNAAAAFLRHGIVNQEQASFFDGVQCFPPGCYAVVNPDTPQHLIPERYWTLDPSNPSPAATTAEAAEMFRGLFLSSVALRMRSDVPVGSCLSGGLDSSSIVCVASAMAEKAGVTMNTFTSCSKDRRFDEKQWADLVSSNTRSNAHHVYPDQDQFIADLPALLWHQEEPFTTASIYAQWSVMKTARDSGVPVLLDGQGGDETLCGYRKFYLFYLRQMAREHSWWQLMREFSGLLVRGDRGLLKWREGKRYMPSSLRNRFSSSSQFVATGFRGEWDAASLDLSGKGSVGERQAQDLLQYSLPSLLRYEDRNSMAWSIESRVPFLDYRLVEMLVSLKPELKLSGGKTKMPLREGLRHILPQAVLDRRDKMGFNTSQETWMRERLGATIEESFLSPDLRVGRLLDIAGLRKAFRRFREGKASPDSAEFFRIHILNSWMGRFNVSC